MITCMRLNRVENSKRNIWYGIINKGVTLILPFMIRTIIIRQMGVEYLGLNSLFSSILQVLNLSELGFSSAVVYSMYRPIAENDDDAICALLNFYRKVYLVIGVSVIVIGIALMPFLQYLISGDVPDGINIYILYAFYVANTAISYLMFAYKTSILEAYQRRDIISNALTITQGGMYLMQILMLVLTHNYYLYLVMMPVFTILNNLINSYKVDHLYPQYKCEGRIHERELGSIKRQVPGLMITKLCYISRNSFDSIFISAFLGLQISAIYGNYYYIMNALIALLQVLTQSILAGIGNSMATETVERNYATMNKINFIYMWIVGWCTICLLCLYQPFMRIWVGADLLFDFHTVVLICIYFYALGMGTIRGAYSDAAGLWWENRYRAILESAANLVLNYALVQFMGVDGIILATLIALIVINFLWGSRIVFQFYFKNHKESEFFLLHARYAGTTMIIAVIMVALCSVMPTTGITDLVLKAVLCCVVPSVLYVVLYHGFDQFHVATQWLLGMTRWGRRTHSGDGA